VGLSAPPAAARPGPPSAVAPNAPGTGSLPAGGGFPGGNLAMPPPPVPAPASDVARLLAFFAVVLACAALGVAVKDLTLATLCASSVALGIVICHLLPVDRIFRDTAGWVIGLVAAIVYFVVVALVAGSSAAIRLPLQPAAYLALVVVGMDWKRADRLRGTVVLSGLFVVVLVFSEQVESVLLAILWLVTAMAALWVLQSDTERGARRAIPVPVGPRVGGAVPIRGAELARIVVISLIGAVALAVVIGHPTASPRLPRPRPFPRLPGVTITVPPGAGSGQPPAGGQLGGGQQLGGSGAGAGGLSSGGGQQLGGSGQLGGTGQLGGSGAGAGGQSSGGGQQLGGSGQLGGGQQLGDSGAGGDGSGNGAFGGDGSGNGGDGSGSGNGALGNGSGTGSGNGGFGTGSGTGSGASSGSSGSTTTGSTAATDTPSDLSALLRVLLGMLAIAAAIAVAVIVLRERDEDDDADDDADDDSDAGRRRRAERRWAIEALARLSAEAAARGRPRRRAETVHHYCDAVATGVLDDARVVDVGRLLSQVFYGRGPITDDERVWADAVLDEVLSRPFAPDDPVAAP
jgi:hypothetical protein